MSFQDVNIKKLTIEKVKEFVKGHSLMIIHNPEGDLFQAEDERGRKVGLLIDVQSLNCMATVYDNLKENNKGRFNDVLQDEYKLASLLDKMWSWVI